MNILRNIFSTRTINYLRQNGQNALINITQPVENASTTSTSISANNNGNNNNNNNNINQSTLIPKSILDGTKFTGKKFNSPAPGSISPQTLKRYRSIERKVELVYRCKLCNTRNSKMISEVAYTSGIVILQCDGCAVNHLIIDNLGWFASTEAKGKSFDEVLAAQSSHVKVIKVNEHGDLL